MNSGGVFSSVVYTAESIGRLSVFSSVSAVPKLVVLEGELGE